MDVEETKEDISGRRDIIIERLPVWIPTLLDKLVGIITVLSLGLECTFALQLDHFVVLEPEIRGTASIQIGNDC